MYAAGYAVARVLTKPFSRSLSTSIFNLAPPPPLPPPNAPSSLLSPILANLSATPNNRLLLCYRRARLSPLTAITVVIPSLGEGIPHGYTGITSSVEGFEARVECVGGSGVLCVRMWLRGVERFGGGGINSDIVKGGWEECEQRVGVWVGSGGVLGRGGGTENMLGGSAGVGSKERGDSISRDTADAADVTSDAQQDALERDSEGTLYEGDDEEGSVSTETTEMTEVPSDASDAVGEAAASAAASAAVASAEKDVPNAVGFTKVRVGVHPRSSAHHHISVHSRSTPVSPWMPSSLHFPLPPPPHLLLTLYSGRRIQGPHWQPVHLLEGIVEDAGAEGSVLHFVGHSLLQPAWE